MSINGRLDRLEDGHGATENESDYTMQAFAGDVLAAIVDGWIVDWSDKDHGRDFDYSSLLGPTVGDGLSEDERSRAYYLLNEAQKTVATIAKHTGWRSTLAIGEPQQWKAYRANSTIELGFLMREIQKYEA